MTAPLLIFDRNLARRRLARAAASGKADDFLLARAIGEFHERLSTIKRAFSEVLDAGTPAPRLAAWLAERFQPRLLVRMAPLLERVQQKWKPVSRPDTRQIKDLEQYDVSKKSHLALETVGEIRLVCLIGDEENLPLAQESFDLAVTALSLQNLNDLPGALIQLRRVLRPDGLFLGCLLGGTSLHELRTALAVAETELCGGISPRVAPFADVRDLGGLLQRAGFALPVADSEIVTVRYASLFDLMADLRAMGATNALVARLRKPSTKGFFMRAAEVYAQRFADPDGRLRATFEMIFLSGWAPHESQQKPLPPGSAKMRLSDALAIQKANRK